jgi:hypothetical protein
MAAKKKTKKTKKKTTAVAKTNDTAVAVWEPKEFKGNDLLPLDDAMTPELIEGVPDLVGREHIDPEDLIVPVLVLLAGKSTAVEDGVDGAEPGVFMHSGTEECLPEGPIRVIIAHHHKGNVLFPKDGDLRYKDLKTCISRDAIEGSEYGLCADCRKCLDWDDENDLPPLGAQTHHFVVMTSLGPVMMRFARSSYKGASKFVSAWKMSRKNLFTHPVVIRVKEGVKALASGKNSTYHFMQMAWQTTEKVPPELQRAAFALYKEIESKHETGNLKSHDEDTADDLFDED